MRVCIPLSLAAALLIAWPGVSAQAAGSEDTFSQQSSAPADPNWAAAKLAIKENDYASALPLLQMVVANDPKNADAFNYLGYSSSRLGQVDQAKAYYGQALALKPKHKGANQYLGELYLSQGDVASAEVRLKVLDKACFFGCDEYYDLKNAINDYKKTGAYKGKHSS